MIPRYTPPIIADLWSERAKWQRVLEVELAVVEVWAEDGILPASAAERIRQKATFDVDKIAAYEEVTRHDVIAFLQSVGDSLGEDKRWLHLGLTSYDVIDTALGMALARSGELILERLHNLREAMVRQAQIHKFTLMPGRTHGVHAEPTTLGWKLCGWLAEADRDIVRLERAIDNIRVGKLSGAVGTYPAISPDQERRVCERLGLKPDPVATQVIARDRHAEFISTLAILGGLVERIALEVRLLQHSEVEELSEPFGKGQRGSSAMPHKKNPVASENLSGLARLLRSYVGAALENIALWHERDISHSSVERIILPDAISVVYYMFDRCAWILNNWTVDVDRMRAHVLEDKGLMASGAILTALKLAGIDDDDIYKRVQKHALAAREEGVPLRNKILADAEITAALGDKLEAVFDEESVLKRVGVALGRVGITSGE